MKGRVEGGVEWGGICHCEAGHSDVRLVREKGQWVGVAVDKGTNGTTIAVATHSKDRQRSGRSG